MEASQTRDMSLSKTLFGFSLVDKTAPSRELIEDINPKNPDSLYNKLKSKKDRLQSKTKIKLQNRHDKFFQKYSEDIKTLFNENELGK